MLVQDLFNIDFEEIPTSFKYICQWQLTPNNYVSEILLRKVIAHMLGSSDPKLLWGEFSSAPILKEDLINGYALLRDIFDSEVRQLLDQSVTA